MNRKIHKEDLKHQMATITPSHQTLAGEKQSLWKTIFNDPQKLFLSQQLFIFVVAFLVFANGITNGFNIDDSFYTTPANKVSTQGIKAITEIFTKPTFLSTNNVAFDYRPVAMLTFALQHEFLNDSAAVSHIISILLYSCICLLVFSQLFRWLGASKAWIAFFITLIYAIHPLHTEVVNNIKCRDELLAHLFCWLSVASIWKWHTTGRSSHFAVCCLLFAIALLCKRDIIVFALIIPASLFFFTDKPEKKILLSFIVLVLLYFVLPLLLRKLLHHTQQRNMEFLENPFAASHQSLSVRTATASYILGWYAYMHVIPYPLSFYYGYNYVQLLNWNSIWPILSLLLYASMFVVFLKNFRKKNIYAFAVAFYLISIVPFSNILTPAPGLIAERFAFESTLGYSIGLVALLHYLFKASADRFPRNRFFLVIFAIICIAYASMSIARNTQWKSSWTLYNHDISHLKNSAKVNLLYSELLTAKISYYWQNYPNVSEAQRAIYRDSISQYAKEQTAALLRVIEIDPNASNVRNNLAVIYSNYENFELAKKYMEEEMTMIPASKENAIYHYNLAWIYENISLKNNSKQLQDSSIAEYKTAIRLNPKNPGSYWKLSHIYLRQYDTATATSILLSGASLSDDLYIELGNIAIYTSDTTTAISYYEKAAATPKPNIEILQYLQDYYHNKGNTSKENQYKSQIMNLNAASTSDNTL